MAPAYFFFGFALGFGFAVFAAFLKSCALGASLLLGFRGFFPALRRALILAYKPFDGMALQERCLNSGAHNKAAREGG